ncbi:MAG TPA: TldD/PmbA family protein [Acidimicrobiales bacterium]
MTRSEDLLALAQRIAAQAGPGEQVEAFVARGRRFNVRAYQGEVESLTAAESSGIGVRVVRGGRQGFAHAGTLDEVVLAEVLADARDNLAFGEPDEWYGLADPDGVPQPDIALFAPELLTMPSADKVALAVELERAVRAADPRISGVRQASYGDGIGEAAIATSTGIAVHTASTACWLSATALAPDGERTQTGGGVGVGRHAGELDLAAVAAEAAEHATRLIGAGPIPSRRLTVVFERRVAASFLAIVAGMLSGERVLKGRSPFAERLGEVVASPLLTLVDDATNPASFGADTTDAEGLATRPTTLLDRGVLRAFLHNTYTGRRTGSGTTASAVRGYTSTPGVGALALAPAPGSQSLDELCATAGDGLLVQSVTGLNSGVNSVSGDFSVGAEGLLIEGGVPTRPVREVTIASTVPRMLLDVVAVGGDLEWLPGGDAGVSLAIADMTLSGA